MQTICEECAIPKREDSSGDAYMITNSQGEEVRGEERCFTCERVAEYTSCLQCMRKEKMRIRNGVPKFCELGDRSASLATGRIWMLGHSDGPETKLVYMECGTEVRNRSTE